MYLNFNIINFSTRLQLRFASALKFALFSFNDFPFLVFFLIRDAKSFLPTFGP